MTAQDELYARVTERITALLEAGTAPWHKPWRTEAGAGAPRNYVSQRPYSGINALLLGLHPGSPQWMTWRQVHEAGGRIRAGAESQLVIFWKLQTYGQDDEERTVPILKSYRVFNLDDTTGLPAPEPVKVATWDPLAEAERIITATSAKIREGSQAAYFPAGDFVTMPDRRCFQDRSRYYGVAFHELTHWTGHATRLGRRTLDEVRPFGSPAYGREELVAEMGAGFLCATLGIENDTIDQSASYLASWLRVLKDDARALVWAAGQAQKAADFILNLAKPEAPAAGTTRAQEVGIRA